MSEYIITKKQIEELNNAHGGMKTPIYDTETEAVEAWNTRHVETCRNVDADPGWFSCSKCGCICSVDWYGSGFGTPDFCPNCGRKVEKG